ncbi:hypothetical protein U1Q18_029860, partial [Sarracenia purpurea var. burkii]
MPVFGNGGRGSPIVCEWEPEMEGGRHERSGSSARPPVMITSRCRLCSGTPLRVLIPSLHCSAGPPATTSCRCCLRS